MCTNKSSAAFDPTDTNPTHVYDWSRQSLVAKRLYDTLFAENAFDESNLLHNHEIIIIK